MKDDKKKVALIARKVIDSSMFGRIEPHLDSEYGVQMSIHSRKRNDILYQVICREGLVTLGVYVKDYDRWKMVRSKGKVEWDVEYNTIYEWFDYMGYGCSDEYRFLAGCIEYTITKE